MDHLKFMVHLRGPTADKSCATDILIIGENRLCAYAGNAITPHYRQLNDM